MPGRFRFGGFMDMYEDGEEEIVLCAASAYERKFYLNPEFEALPEGIRR